MNQLLKQLFSIFIGILIINTIFNYCDDLLIISV